MQQTKKKDLNLQTERATEKEDREPGREGEKNLNLLPFISQNFIKSKDHSIQPRQLNMHFFKKTTTFLKRAFAILLVALMQN